MSTRFCPTCGNDATANGLCAHQCPPDWRAIAGKLAARLRHHHPLDTGAPGCEDCKVLAEFDRAKEGT